MASQQVGAEGPSLAPSPRCPCDYLIAKLAAVADLSPDDERAVHAVWRNAREVAARRTILSEGEQPDHVHIMVEGWAARSKTLPDGSRQITAFLLPGDICDLHVTILGEMDHDIVALTDAKVAYVSHRAMEDLPRDRPELGRALWWATLVDEAVLRSWIVNIGRRDAHSRIAHLFCELHARLMLVGLAGDACFHLPLTQEVLADAQGLTAVHVNRTLQTLRREGLIELSRQTLTIPDIGRLRMRAGFDPNYLHRRRLARASGGREPSARSIGAASLPVGT